MLWVPIQTTVMGIQHGKTLSATSKSSSKIDDYDLQVALSPDKIL